MGVLIWWLELNQISLNGSGIPIDMGHQITNRVNITVLAEVKLIFIAVALDLGVGRHL